MRSLKLEFAVRVEKLDEDRWMASSDTFDLKVFSATHDDVRDRFEEAVTYMLESLAEKKLLDRYLPEHGVMHFFTEHEPERFTVTQTFERELALV